MQRLLACIMHTDALNTDPDSCPPEVKPRPMKTIYNLYLSVFIEATAQRVHYLLMQRNRRRQTLHHGESHAS